MLLRNPIKQNMKLNRHNWEKPTRQINILNPLCLILNSYNLCVFQLETCLLSKQYHDFLIIPLANTYITPFLDQ